MSPEIMPSPQPGRRPSAIASVLTLSNLKVRAIFLQLLVVGCVIGIAWFLVTTTRHNLESRSIATGFGFLNRQAGIPIGEAILAYTPADTYGRALAVGLVNTAKVALLGIVFATICGTAIGIARLSKNWLLSRLAGFYVEVTRDIPLLLQLVFWYSVLQGLPSAREALSPFPGAFLSNRGLYLPSINLGFLHGLALFALIVAGGLALRNALASPLARSKKFTFASISAFILATALFFSGGAPEVDIPALSGFNFRGGYYVSPEFFALLFGLVAYTAAFIAEIVRAGILAVRNGQWEAGFALGLSRAQILRKIVVPQALRIIVPPLTSQYVNLTKNSSLAVAIGYQETVSIANTTLNQTGQAIEVIALIMSAYLIVSLSISLVMNWHDHAIQLKAR